MKVLNIFFVALSFVGMLVLSSCSSSNSSKTKIELPAELQKYSDYEQIEVKYYDKRNMRNIESYLLYKDITEGTGSSPMQGQKIAVHYTGTLLNGDIFDTSSKRGTPIEFSFGTGQVIKGWDEGLASMKEGGKRILVIPSDLGYGSTATGKIPANSTLVFEVELVKTY